MWKAASRFVNRLRPGRDFADRPARQHRRALLPFLAVAVAAACALASNDSGLAQTIDGHLWATNGYVAAVLHDRGTIYIGGDFTKVGPELGGGVPIDAASGAPMASFPKVSGWIRKVISDGAGGWYISGVFDAVGGIPRSNVAHLASDLTVSAWNPDPNGFVYALVMSGSTVYAGGGFTSIGGVARNHIAALDATTGAVASWNPDANSDVFGLAVSGSTVYVGGTFTSIAGRVRNGIAAIDAATGAATAFDPNASGPVGTLTVSGSTIYVSGGFTSIGGKARNYLAALDATTGRRPRGTQTPADPSALSQ